MTPTHYRQINKKRNSITSHLQTDTDTQQVENLRRPRDGFELTLNSNRPKKKKCTTCPLQIDSDSIQIKKQNNETVTAGVTYRTLKNNQIQQKPANCRHCLSESKWNYFSLQGLHTHVKKFSFHHD